MIAALKMPGKNSDLIETVTGDRLRFGADHRPARDIVAALALVEPVLCEVEAWQVL